jgi:PAS domain-containing protein
MPTVNNSDDSNSRLARLSQKIGQMEDLQLNALSAANVGLWCWDVEDEKLYWNDTMFSLYEVDRATFGGTFDEFQNLIHPDDVVTVNFKTKQCLEGGQPFDYTFRVRSSGSDGWKLIKSRGNLLQGPNGHHQLTGITIPWTQSVLHFSPA